MAQEAPRGDDLVAAQREAVAFHRGSAPDAVSLWGEGLSLVYRGIEPMNGQQNVGYAQAVQTALLLTALQTVYSAYDLAMRGYYPQALNLLRSPLEHALAFMYLLEYPEAYERFTDLSDDPSKRTPDANEMVQALETKHGPLPLLRDWLKQLNPFSHVDRRIINMVTEHRPNLHVFLLGPQQNDWFFRCCTEQGAGVLGALLGAVSDLRGLLGHEPLDSVEPYADRVGAWARAQTPPWER